MINYFKTHFAPYIAPHLPLPSKKELADDTGATTLEYGMLGAGVLTLFGVIVAVIKSGVWERITISLLDAIFELVKSYITSFMPG